MDGEYRRKTLEEILSEPESVGIERREKMQRRIDEKKRRWLAQFDSEGHVRIDVLLGSNYIQNMNREFLRMTPEEQAAYIISEKKRLGVL